MSIRDVFEYTFRTHETALAGKLQIDICYLLMINFGWLIIRELNWRGVELYTNCNMKSLQIWNSCVKTR